MTVQPTSAASTTHVAQEVLWAYWSASEAASEHDFFASSAFERAVAQAIGGRIRTGTAVWVGREIRMTVGRYTIGARLINLEPVLATVVTEDTRVSVQYLDRDGGDEEDISTFVSEVIRYPNETAEAQFRSLVGLRAISDDLFRKLALLLNAATTEAWARQQYGARPPAGLLSVLHDRYPLVILEGEVGAGKTALARSIGQPLATNLHTDIALFVVNSQVRGGGHVGELTQNISRAFTAAERTQEREQVPVMLLIDEADALAQARGGRQTHHEDDAGVNTLIQRIDRLRGRPMAVMFATNLVQSLDSAILRRATTAYHFQRPATGQRAEVFRRVLREVELTDEQVTALARATDPRPLPGFSGAKHRYTYSDITQRIIPTAVEEAIWAQQPVDFGALERACAAVAPTPELRIEG